MAQLDTNRIAQAALAVIAANGTQGFSMRAVARELDVTPMALYHHVKDKAALATLTVEAAIQEVPFPHRCGDWREDLFAIALWVRQTFRANPAVAQLRRRYQVWLPSMLELTKVWQGIWLQSGLDDDRAIRASTASTIAIVGLVEEEMNLQALPRPDEAVMARLSELRPILESTLNTEGDYELLVRALIEGLYSQLSRC